MSKRNRGPAAAGRPAPRASAAGPGVRRRGAATAPSRRRLLPLAIGGLVVVVAAVLAILASQPGGPPAGGATSTRPVPAGGATGSAPPASLAGGEALPPFESTEGDPALGRLVPEVSGAAFDGSPVAIQRDGRPKVLLFLAHWCPHCQAEVPKIQAWIDANGLPDGVDFISVATSIDPNRPNHPPDAWLARERWAPPVLVDTDGSVADAFGLTAFPYWVAVTGDGTVAGRITGALETERLDSLVATLAATAASPAPDASPSRAPAGS